MVSDVDFYMSEASSKGIAACQDADATCIYETNIIIPLASLHFASLRFASLGAGQKYPAHLCKGKSDSYKAYSATTGMGAEGPTSSPAQTSPTQTAAVTTIPPSPNYEHEIPIASLQTIINKFVLERDWTKFHTPRNVALALVGEMGELAEIFQWKGDAADSSLSFEDDELTHIGQELADVTIYALRLATLTNCNLD